MTAVFYTVGVITVVVVCVYSMLVVLHRFVRDRHDPFIPVGSMPVLRPIPIPTKKQPSEWRKIVEFVVSVRQWELAENWHYILPDGTRVILPEKFRFDGASIPKIFWAVLSPTGLLLIPGLLHDYGYRHDQLWVIGHDGQPKAWKQGEGKEFWDKLFLEVGNEVNGIALVNGIAWLAVKFGGTGSWKKRRKEDQQAVTPTL